MKYHNLHTTVYKGKPNQWQAHQDQVEHTRAPNFGSELTLPRTLVLSRSSLHANWLKVVPNPASGPLESKPRDQLQSRNSKNNDSICSQRNWEVSDSEFFPDQFLSRNPVIQRAGAEAEAGHWNDFQPKQKFIKIEQKWCLPLLRELFCESKWISRGRRNLKPVSVCCSGLAVFYSKNKAHSYKPN